MRWEIDGFQAKQLESVHCGQILQHKGYGRSKEELRLAWIKDRNHLVLILEVKETPRRTHSQKGSSGIRERKGTRLKLTVSTA